MVLDLYDDVSIAIEHRAQTYLSAGRRCLAGIRQHPIEQLDTSNYRSNGAD